MPKLYYFQAPNFSINPDSDIAPKLGSIFYNLDRLTGPLNQYDNGYIPSNLKNQSISTEFTETTAKGHSGSVGLNANVLQGIGGCADVVYTFAKDKKNVYHCESLETVEFEPTKEFIKDSITRSQQVQSTFKNAMFGRKRVFMITGLKIATGFSFSTAKETQHGPSLKIGVDLTPLGAPVEVGPETDFETKNARTVSQGRSTNKVVFAYRVIRIREKGDGEVKFKHEAGGSYSIDPDSDDEDQGWDVEPLDEQDVAKDFSDPVAIEIQEEKSTSEH